MKSIVCDTLGNIFYATLKKDGKISEKDRVNVTEASLKAVANHIMNLPPYMETGYCGYKFKTKDGGEIILSVIDTAQYDVVRKDDGNTAEEEQE